MEAPYHEKATRCNFPGVNGVQYMCFHNEICCSEGCCQKPPYVIFRIWYLWIVILGIFFVCSGGLKCCKLLRKPRTSRRRARSSSRRDVPRDPRPDLARFNNDESLWRYLDGLGEEDAIERYLACREAKSHKREASSPPPYNSLRKSAGGILESSEPPPQYNTVFKVNAPKMVQVVEVHEALSKAEHRQPNNSQDTIIYISDGDETVRGEDFGNRGEPERKDV